MSYRARQCLGGLPAYRLTPRHFQYLSRSFVPGCARLLVCASLWLAVRRQCPTDFSSARPCGAMFFASLSLLEVLSAPPKERPSPSASHSCSPPRSLPSAPGGPRPPQSHLTASATENKSLLAKNAALATAQSLRLAKSRASLGCSLARALWGAVFFPPPVLFSCSRLFGALPVTPRVPSVSLLLPRSQTSAPPTAAPVFCVTPPATARHDGLGALTSPRASSRPSRPPRAAEPAAPPRPPSPA